MLKFLQGISITTLSGAAVAFCVFLDTAGVELGHIGHLSGVNFLAGVAAFVGIWSAKDWRTHSTLEQVHESTASVEAGGPPVAGPPKAK